MSAQPAGQGAVLDMRSSAARRVAVMSLVRAIGSATVIVAAYYVLPVAASGGQIGVRLVASALAIAIVIVWQVRGIQRSEHPGFRALEALAIAASIMVSMFASAYLSLSESDPGAFNEPLGRTGALYFTMTTVTTVGFGDIAARTEAARVAVMLQMVFNVVVIGAGIKLIVSTARQRMDTVRTAGRADHPAGGDADPGGRGEPG
jgi:hypothetical protein